MTDILKYAYNSGTELSREGNYILGDRTGRTITRTTMDGVSVISNGAINPSGELVHAAMISTAILLFSKKKEFLFIGLMILLLLLIFYFAGRE